MTICRSGPLCKSGSIPYFDQFGYLNQPEDHLSIRAAAESPSRPVFDPDPVRGVFTDDSTGHRIHRRLLTLCRAIPFLLSQASLGGCRPKTPLLFWGPPPLPLFSGGCSLGVPLGLPPGGPCSQQLGHAGANGGSVPLFGAAPQVPRLMLGAPPQTPPVTGTRGLGQRSMDVVATHVAAI